MEMMMQVTWNLELEAEPILAEPAGGDIHDDEISVEDDDPQADPAGGAAHSEMELSGSDISILADPAVGDIHECGAAIED